MNCATGGALCGGVLCFECEECPMHCECDEDSAADIFDPEDCEPGDLVCLSVNMLDILFACVASVRHTGAGRFSVRVETWDDEERALSYTMHGLRAGDRFDVQQDDVERAREAVLKRSGRMPPLEPGAMGYARAPRFSDREAKYEAYLDFEVAGLAESTLAGLKTRNRYYIKKKTLA